MTRAVKAALAFAVLAFTHAAAAHEVRPAYLEIDQSAAGTYRVIWKQPTMGDVAIHLAPRLSNGWLDHAPADQYAAADSLIRIWDIADAGAAPLAGQTIRIEGLENTITDVYVRIRLLNGPGVDTMLRPESPQLIVAPGTAVSKASFLLLGMQHILTGPDHLLFVLGLLLLVSDGWSLLKTVSAFTLAHSMTLAAATFGLITPSVPLLNALIALSILFLALEILRARRGRTSLTIRHPWVVAFSFGLLHGMGFASGLNSLGLDRSALLSALILFNVGVEIGQLAFIALILGLRRAFLVLEIAWPKPLALAPTYLIGVLGAAWTIRYSALLFGVLL